ncbi:NlpC/P60 family protein [Streptomyces sp. NPDC003456]|uniref:C40 family peptidase n=1 Tax=Streptomyces sp. NPDC003456 TaxID=3364683 RepID=UPI0036C9BD86
MSGRLVRLVCVVAASAAAATTVLAPAPATAAPKPEPAEDASVATLLTDLQKLYRKTEKATEAYNAAEERLKEQRAETGRLERALVRARLSLYDSRGAAGRLARQQYQSSTDISPYVRLLLARDPQHAIEQGQVIGRLARERAEAVGRLTGAERAAGELARTSRKALDRQLVLAERRRKARDEVRERLREVEKMLTSLSREQLTALAELEADGITKAQQEFLASGALGGTTEDERAGDEETADKTAEKDDGGDEDGGDEDGGGGDGKNRDHRKAGGREGVRRPSAAGARAVRYAVRQLGKPYEWGAEGPKSYDCSGLTSRAWAAAGKTVPRTSQQQWKRLARVPLNRLRPGDLVVYFPEATHVAVYLGDGMVVQAPRPGARVKVSPIAANPVLGAVRPDPGGKPLRRYRPPELPESAVRGSDKGYGAYAAPAPDTSAR